MINYIRTSIPVFNIPFHLLPSNLHIRNKHATRGSSLYFQPSCDNEHTFNFNILRDTFKLPIRPSMNLLKLHLIAYSYSSLNYSFFDFPRIRKKSIHPYLTSYSYKSCDKCSKSIIWIHLLYVLFKNMTRPALRYILSDRARRKRTCRKS